MTGWTYLLGMTWALYMIFLLPLFIKKEKQIGIEKAVCYKLALSGVFCLLGLVGILHHNGDIFCALVFCGLVFSMAGDKYLVYIKSDINKFIKGILYFGSAQICYIISIASMEGLHLPDFAAALTIAIPVIIMMNNKKQDMGRAKIPLCCYAVLVIFMTTKAVMMIFYSDNVFVFEGVFAAGAVLFLVSDACLGIWRYLNTKQVYSYLVTICYFTGQLMIATAAFLK